MRCRLLAQQVGQRVEKHFGASSLTLAIQVRAVCYSGLVTFSILNVKYRCVVACNILCSSVVWHTEIVGDIHALCYLPSMITG